MMRGTGPFEGQQPLGWKGEATRNNINNVTGIPGWSPFADPKSCVMPGANPAVAIQGAHNAPEGPVEAFGEGVDDLVADPTEPASSAPIQNGRMGGALDAAARVHNPPAEVSRSGKQRSLGVTGGRQKKKSCPGIMSLW